MLLQLKDSSAAPVRRKHVRLAVDIAISKCSFNCVRALLTESFVKNSCCEDCGWQKTQVHRSNCAKCVAHDASCPSTCKALTDRGALCAHQVQKPALLLAVQTKPRDSTEESQLLQICKLIVQHCPTSTKQNWRGAGLPMELAAGSPNKQVIRWARSDGCYMDRYKRAERAEYDSESGSSVWFAVDIFDDDALVALKIVTDKSYFMSELAAR